MRGRLERVSYVLRGCFVVGVSQFTFILPSEEPASRIRKSPLGGAGLAQGAAGTIKWFCNHRPAATFRVPRPQVRVSSLQFPGFLNYKTLALVLSFSNPLVSLMGLRWMVGWPRAPWFGVRSTFASQLIHVQT